MTTACIEDLARASRIVGDLIAGIPLDQWTAPTPCSEWNVRDVVSHLVGTNLVFVALIEGEAMPDRAANHLGDDPVAAYRASAAAVEAAFGGPGVLERSIPGPLGDATGAERLTIRLADLLAHGWDLAQATGSRVTLPGDLAEQSLAFMQKLMSGQPRAGRFDEPQPTDDTAAPIDRLAAFLGRRVQPES